MPDGMWRAEEGGGATKVWYFAEKSSHCLKVDGVTLRRKITSGALPRTTPPPPPSFAQPRRKLVFNYSCNLLFHPPAISTPFYPSFRLSDRTNEFTELLRVEGEFICIPWKTRIHVDASEARKKKNLCDWLIDKFLIIFSSFSNRIVYNRLTIFINFQQYPDRKDRGEALIKVKNYRNSIIFLSFRILQFSWNCIQMID